MIARANHATRVVRALPRPQWGLFYLPPLPIRLTIPSIPFVPLSAALRRNGVIWFIASAIIFAIIVAPVVQQKIRKHATSVYDMGRYDTLVYRDGAQRLSFNDRWAQTTAPFALTAQDLPNPVQTIQIAKTNYRPDELVFAPAFADTTSSARFTLASLPAGATGETVMEDPKEKQALARMDEVERYLWDVYKRVLTKKDKSGDFTWKDPAAAKRFGISMPAYVIGGMDPDFREQLYAMGKAMDAAGVKWAIQSAFRDDYRQGLASGYKASARNSLHGPRSSSPSSNAACSRSATLARPARCSAGTRRPTCRRAAPARARQGATLRRLAHEKFVDPALGRLIDQLAPHAESLPYDPMTRA